MAYYFKILDKRLNGGFTKYNYPKPGVWNFRIDGELLPCIRGYHVCRTRDIFHWVDFDKVGSRDIWLVETKGRRVSTFNKVVVRQVKLIRKLPLKLSDLRKAVGVDKEYFYTDNWCIFLYKYQTFWEYKDIKKKRLMRNLLKLWGLKATF